MSTPASPAPAGPDPSASETSDRGALSPASLLRPQLPESLKRFWWVFLITGVLSVIVGIAALVRPDEALVVIALLVGFWLVLWAGFVVAMTLAQTDASGGQKALGIVIAILSFVAGVLIIARPWEGARAIALTFGLWLILSGIVAAAQAAADERDRGLNTCARLST